MPCPNIGDGKEDFLHLAKPHNVDVSIELKDWLFALEGPDGTDDRWQGCDNVDVSREERSWHMAFQSLHMAAKSKPEPGSGINCKEKSNGVSRYPLESVIVSISCFCLYILSSSVKGFSAHRG